MATLSSDELLTTVQKPETSILAASTAGAAEAMAAKIPHLETMDIGLGMAGGVILFLEKRGIPHGQIAHMFSSLAEALRKNPS